MGGRMQFDPAKRDNLLLNEILVKILFLGLDGYRSCDAAR